MSDLAIAAILAAAILAASTISVEIGLSVALVELTLGVVVGNVFSLSVPGWLSFVGSFAGIVLTFLAGAEVDVPQFKREWRGSLLLGGVSFAGPFGLNAGIIDRMQFSLLITVAVLSAIVPSAIAQHFFQPRHEAAEAGMSGRVEEAAA